MCAKARIAEREFTKENSISIRRTDNLFGASLHGHDFYELEIITGGSCKAILNGKVTVAARGAIFFLSPADFHEYTECKDVSLYKVQFTSDAVSSDILDTIVLSAKNLYTPREDHFERVRALASIMESSADGEISSDIYPRLLECILLIIAGEKNASENSKSRFEGPDINIQRALMYIHAHFRENPSLSEIARTVHLNSHYLCSKFHAYTGKPYKQYLREIKLRYARRLIMATDMSIISIAENSGYTAQSHFNREFKEYYGISPLALRKTKKEG